MESVEKRAGDFIATEVRPDAEAATVALGRLVPGVPGPTPYAHSRAAVDSAIPATARHALVSMNLRSGTATPAATHRSYHSKVASDAHGVMTGPTFTPMSSPSSCSWLAAGT